MKGRGIFQDLKFYDSPNKNVTFFITSQIIEKYYTNLLSEKRKGFDVETKDGHYSFMFYVNLRSCIAGEIFLNTVKKYFKT
jgi:hypothetical protein